MIGFGIDYTGAYNIINTFLLIATIIYLPQIDIKLRHCLNISTKKTQWIIIMIDWYYDESLKFYKS